MSSRLTTLKEWINPDWGRLRAVPPMDRGLRANMRLDEARRLVPDAGFAPDDVVLTDDGDLVFTSGTTVVRLRDGEANTLVDTGQPVAALAAHGDRLLLAVEGRGVLSISPSGGVQEVCTDSSVRSCVTDLAVSGDGSLMVTVGSTRLRASEWRRALVTADRSGTIVRVEGAHAQVVAEGLAWPSGIATADGEVVVAISLEHRVERWDPVSGDRRRSALAANLPVYPGRICVDGDSYWLAAPYVRNRVTEMLLDEPELLAEMTETIRPDEWFVPRLRGVDPFTDTMQMGQLRVLGVVKSWAPARSCGLVFRMDRSGRVLESAHARVDSDRHGVTGVAAREGQVVVAAQGFGDLLQFRSSER